jgi:Ca2+:H+ antiporter
MLIRRLFSNTPLWSVGMPLAACGMLAAFWGREQGWLMLSAAAGALLATVMIAVHHAEVIAHRVGEPFGTLVLALAVTVIEASLIVSMMLAGGDNTAALARDTVFATVMIICNGVIGLCLLLGSLKHRVIAFNSEGTTPALAVLATLSVLTMVLPDYTSSTPGPTLSNPQLAFAGIISLILYGIFIFVQTVRHRNYFMTGDTSSEDTHAEPPSASTALISLALLVISLITVVGLAKVLAPAIETAVATAGMPHAVVGIAIALMVLLPETVAAVRAARNDRMQTSFNLALGSALATIGLTIPVVAAISIYIVLPLALGLPAKEIALLALTLLLTSMTLASGRATVLQGAVHLVVFAVFLFLAMVP